MCSCELGICIWDEISQMRETCFSPVSMSIQGLACPGGGNKLLLLLYHLLLIVNNAYLLTWGAMAMFCRFQKPVCLQWGGQKSLWCAVSHLYCESITGTSSSGAAHFWQPLPSHILVLQVDPSSTLLAVPLSSLKSHYNPLKLRKRQEEGINGC